MIEIETIRIAWVKILLFCVLSNLSNIRRQHVWPSKTTQSAAHRHRDVTSDTTHENAHMTHVTRARANPHTAYNTHICLLHYT